MLLGSKLAMPHGVIISRRLTIGKCKIGSQVSDRCPLGYLFYIKVGCKGLELYGRANMMQSVLVFYCQPVITCVCVCGGGNALST